ncbi:hypothetical protein ACIBG8_07655 [Nonomuraea sp. NPDC050556]|uniref:hypothetical protein n=1 Tax=Nonomuraea sp. NPDC050556 TaxID=3364369 RepID=UPI0037879E6C
MTHTRYVATGIIEADTFLTDLNGDKLPRNYLLVITQADTDEPEVSSDSLYATDMVIAVIDTHTCYCQPTPDWDQVLASHGWKRPDDAHWVESDGCFQTEVAADDATQVPPPVIYDAGEPLPLYVKAAEAREAGASVEHIIDAVAWAAAQDAHLDSYGLTWDELHDRVEDAAHDAAAIAAGALGLTADETTGRDAQLIVAAAIDAAYEVLEEKPAFCRTCDKVATGMFEGQPVCSSGH